MNIMGIPGYTAEASLYKTSRHYLSRERTSNLIGEIFPALPQKQGSTKCTNCPADRPVPCDGIGVETCLCCKYGCDHTVGGTPSCPPKPSDIISSHPNRAGVLDGIFMQ